jgi:hypothetical protein
MSPEFYYNGTRAVSLEESRVSSRAQENPETFRVYKAVKKLESLDFFPILENTTVDDIVRSAKNPTMARFVPKIEAIDNMKFLVGEIVFIRSIQLPGVIVEINGFHKIRIYNITDKTFRNFHIVKHDIAKYQKEGNSHITTGLEIEDILRAIGHIRRRVGGTPVIQDTSEYHDLRLIHATAVFLLGDAGLKAISESFPEFAAILSL